MGSSCMQNKKDELHNSMASQNLDNFFRMQQDVNLVYPKQVSDTISSVSSFSSIKSYRQNKNSNQKSHFYQMKTKMKKFIETKRESIKTEKEDKDKKCSMEYLIPSPQKDPSKDSSKSLEIQTITLSIPKTNKKNRYSLSSRRIYSKKDLLEKVKQNQRHSVIVKVNDD